jgi:hypothetical protein
LSTFCSTSRIGAVDGSRGSRRTLVDHRRRQIAARLVGRRRQAHSSVSPIASIRRSPPLKLPARSRRRSASRGNSARDCLHVVGERRRPEKPPIFQLSITVRSAKTLRSWGT